MGELEIVRSSDDVSIVSRASDGLKMVLMTVVFLRECARNAIVGALKSKTSLVNSRPVVDLLPLDDLDMTQPTVTSCALQRRVDGSLHITHGASFLGPSRNFIGCSFSSGIYPLCHHEGGFVQRRSLSDAVKHHAGEPTSVSVFCYGGVVSPLDPEADWTCPATLNVNNRSVEFHPDESSSIFSKISK